MFSIGSLNFNSEDVDNQVAIVSGSSCVVKDLISLRDCLDKICKEGSKFDLVPYSTHIGFILAKD